MRLILKVSLIFLVMALLANGILLITFYFSTQRIFQQAIGANQIEIARHTLDKIDRLLQERQKDIQSIAKRNDFTMISEPMSLEDQEHLSAFLDVLVVATGPWDRLHLINRDGIIVASNNRRQLGKSAGKSEEMSKALEVAGGGNLYCSDRVIAMETGKPTIIFAVPIREEHKVGRPQVGVLVGLFAWPAVVEILQDVESHAVLVNSKGDVIAENDFYPEERASNARTDMSRHALFPAFKKAKRSVVIAPSGRSFLSSEAMAVFAPQKGYLDFQGSGWGLILEIPARVALGAAKKAAAVDALSLLPVVLVGSAVALGLVARFIVRPVVELTQTAQAVEKGDYTKRAVVCSRDEIGQLATTFNTMLSKIQESYNLLEERVRQRTEELSQANAALEKSNHELDDFTYIVSHDLKEPLRSLDAFSKFLTEDYKEQLGEEGRSYLDRIRANAKRMQELVEDLLEISRLSRKPNELQKTSIQELIEDVRLRFEYVLAEKKVQLIVPEKLPALLCDRVRLTEVFANLISNAIKYCDKPQCRIEIGHCLNKDHHHEFFVRDNGPGIEKQYFDKIFQIFQRLGRKEDHEGTGVGLTIVKKVIELHHGKIWVQSELGQGATFYFTIPQAA